MILRRFMKHVSDQNWFAVGLDVLVVITGIFLGMQVTEWNEARKDRLLEREYLVRLLAEADQSLVLQKQTMDEMELQRLSVNRVIEKLDDKSLVEADLSAFSEDYRAVRYWWAPRYYTETLDEMMSSGKLTLLRSAHTRAAISRFLEDHMIAELSVQNIGTMIMDNTVHLDGLLRWRLSASGTPQLATPITEVYANPAILKRVSGIGLKQQAIRSRVAYFHEKSQVFRNVLFQALEELE